MASADVWRLLNQATFGASQAEAARVVALGIPGWIDDQFTKAQSGYPDNRYNRIQLQQTPDCTTTDPATPAILTMLRSVIGSFTEHHQLVIGAVFVVSVIFFPKGLVGYAVQAIERRRARASR